MNGAISMFPGVPLDDLIRPYWLTMAVLFVTFVTISIREKAQESRIRVR